MPGSGSPIQLLRVFGIRVTASPSWFVVLFIGIYYGSDYFRDELGGSVTEGYLVAVAAVMLFFVSLVAHELGHALVARREGIEISGIELWLLGGIARMSRDTQSPGAEFRVAAAGPLVTLVLFGIFLGLSTLVQHGAALDFARFAGDAEASPTFALLDFIASINLMLLVFNLIPAFPLDGGRIARAAAWRLTGDRGRSTRIAARIGEGFAYLLIGLGIFLAFAGYLFNGIWLVVLGWFIAQSARAAVASTAFTERIDGITVADIMDAQPVSMPAGTPVIQAQEEYFLRYRWDWFPVVDDGGRFVGVVRELHIDREIAAGRPVREVGELVEAGEAESWRVQADRPLESLLGDEQLRSHGALMAVDADGVLRGVVTLDQVRRALTAALPQRLA
ncbi:MAG TPA: site-2 protease family protein [Solirubrobacteraceae bacterium]|jgi:Zn-dependent protease|nr:site-2 protease family protein [Solirubrobacteraceae bacterium]